MATQEDYEIGSTSSTTKLTALTTPVNVPRGTFEEWSATFTKADGSVVGHGYPRATWHFDWLSQDMVDQLRTFCAAGNKSASVHIVTRRYDGTFVKYSAIMHWPEDQLSMREARDFYTNAVFEFTRMEAA